MLILRREYRDDTNIERVFLLGDFGVRMEGRELTAIAPIRTLNWGDIGPQGLPFYTGNVEYLLPVTVPETGRFALQVEQYRGALIGLKLDGRDAGELIYSPYLAELSADPGPHTLSLVLYGTRQNGFASCTMRRSSGSIKARTPGAPPVWPGNMNIS